MQRDSELVGNQPIQLLLVGNDECFYCLNQFVCHWLQNVVFVNTFLIVSLHRSLLMQFFFWTENLVVNFGSFRLTLEKTMIRLMCSTKPPQVGC